MRSSPRRARLATRRPRGGPYCRPGFFEFGLSNEKFASWVGTYYLGEDHIAIPSENITRWAEWMEKHERHVAEEHVCGARVSTVFLGVDHAFVSGPPVLFESLV